ncbi:NAD(P)/FAD-dependent oxidoreductase [Shewanella sp. KX20019]|uniref:flavin-containing monooxygenase n=1 Tax=Shewanella sp. KX20019 TaxID=2803864 RepID=UPI0019288DCC|nr:NAD(P)/FAD-dependent oxidoreductase [Shewanella sp. KX20019]QQX80334.1 NAD(P)/FAD-dependent oxidoreductase [Shewanella sp. KX20019]
MSLIDVVVIGAGQNGLYAAKRLQEQGINYLVLERNNIGEVWDHRLQGMKLFTSRQFCQLPGLAFPGERQSFPSVVEMGQYLRHYADTFNLNVQQQSAVIAMEKRLGVFHITTQNGTELTAKVVINTTGANQSPIIPKFAEELSERVIQHSALLPSLADIKSDTRVLVVGDGATGRQIAGGLATRCNVTLSQGKKRTFPPNRILGKDIFWWLKVAGILFADRSSKVAQIIKKRNPVPCGQFNNKNLRAMGVTLKGRLVRVADRRAYFNDGRLDGVDVVIWAIGYRDQTDWLNIPECIDERGFAQDRGLTAEPGLFLIGQKWLSCRASELILGVERDVNLVISQVESFIQKGVCYE